MLVEEDRREDGDDRRGHEDEDVEERQLHMAKGDNNADVVGKVETRADKLAAGLRWPERRHFAARKRVGGEEPSDEQAQKANDFVGREVGAPHHLDDAVGKYPAGEAADGEDDCGQVGVARRRFGLTEVGLRIRGQNGRTDLDLKSGYQRSQRN